MKRGSAADFLVRTVLDEAFRELAIANPQRAFEGYELSEEEKDILRSRDHRLLGLLGEAVAHKEALAEQPLQKEHFDPTGPTLPSLPEVKLLLRLAPHVPQSPGSEPKVTYAASLHPWPCDDELKTGPDADEQAKGQTGAAVGEVGWIIRIVPNVVESREAGLTVAYSASIHPMMTDSDQTPPSAREPTEELASPPWNHHVESSAAKTAVRAVQAADPGERYGKLLELVHALQTGDNGG
jgi:hypothetical protein